MKPSPHRARFVSAASLVSAVCLLVLPGCGHRASKPAFSLSEKDRTTLEKYETIRKALAVDDLRAAKRAAEELRKLLKPAPDSAATTLDGPVDEIADAPMLDKARSGFMTLSVSMVKLADGVEGYYIADSPVPEGAEWVQRSPRVENPYVGKAMRDVGTLRK